MLEENGRQVQGQEGLRLIVGLMREETRLNGDPLALKRVLSAPHRGEVRPSRDLPHGWETVLVIQDRVLAGDVMCRILERSGYMMLVAQDAGQALRLAEEYRHPVHLVIVDGVLKPDHVELIARLTERNPQTRVLYISGYTGAALGHLIGPHAFLRKPFTIPALLRKVRDILDEPPDARRTERSVKEI